jgi:hypothetical protein
VTLCTTSYSTASNVILACVLAGIVVDLFYQGEVLPQLQEVCDEACFSDYAAKFLVFS